MRVEIPGRPTGPAAGKGPLPTPDPGSGTAEVVSLSQEKIPAKLVSQASDSWLFRMRTHEVG